MILKISKISLFLNFQTQNINQVFLKLHTHICSRDAGVPLPTSMGPHPPNPHLLGHLHSDGGRGSHSIPSLSCYRLALFLLFSCSPSFPDPAGNTEHENIARRRHKQSQH